MAAKNHWLMKTEPSTYSIDNLKSDKKTPWTSVRSYQARNHMRDGMTKDDLVLFYHSSAEPPGVAGIAKVASAPYADPTQFDKKSDYFDGTATKEEPRWFLVDVAFVEKFGSLVPLDALKANPKLKGMLVTQRGHRPSVQPVSKEHFAEILRMARAKTRV